MLQSTSQAQSSDGWIGCLTYKSLATSSPGSADLQALVGQARARNRSLDVTGMLLFENGYFLQTLEGPPDKLDLLWSSIKRDVRHDHIEVLSEHIVPARVFSNWNLLHYDRADRQSARGKASRLAPEAVAGYIDSLVRLALDADDVRVNALIASLSDQGWKSAAIITLLIEPAARAMGDAWLADDCSELDLTIGLSMLQLAGHTVRYNPAADWIRNSRYSILLATAPGEQHMLSTSLLADQFTDAGWKVDMAFPDSDEALANQVNAQHPDAVDIGLSDAMLRAHALPQLRCTIEHSRLATLDHPTVISVGGRLFTEAAASARSVGADHARKTAAGASIRMAQLVRQKRDYQGQ